MHFINVINLRRLAFHHFLAEQRSLLEHLDELRTSQGLETGPDRLVREAAQGHVDIVRDILTKYPEKVGILMNHVMFLHFIFKHEHCRQGSWQQVTVMM